MKFIVLNGPRKVGKDTSFNIIKGLIEHFTDRPVVEISFKEVLYKEVAKRYNLHAETVKQMNEDHDIKTERTLIFGGKSVVEALIYESEVVLRTEGNDLMVAQMACQDLIRTRGQLSQDTILLNRDGGFITEIDYVTGEFAINACDRLIIRLEREGCNFNGDSRDYLPTYNAVVDNNELITDLMFKLKEVVVPFVKSDDTYEVTPITVY